MIRNKLFACLRALLPLLLVWVIHAPQLGAAQEGQEKRIALVIGNAAYGDAALPTTANDAGLIAQQLQAAGFDVTGARDLDGDSLRRAFRDFVDKARQTGPDTVAMVYFAGYGLQFEGENYVVPVDAQIPTPADVPIQSARVSDLTRALAQLPMKARIVVLDAARENPFAKRGGQRAGGFALVDPDPGLLIAFNAAPGTVAPPENGEAYGPYARALAEMIREGGLSLKDVFDQVRLRVSDDTRGAVVPWEADRIDIDFVFFARSPDAPIPPPAANLSALRDRPLKELGADEAYQAALQRDTVEAYQDYLALYPKSHSAKRARAILAARREAIIWRRTLDRGTPDAYWSYLKRYPHGPHAEESRLWLARLTEPAEPPPNFEPIDYGLPPPPPEETVIVDRPVLVFADFGLPPPPPVVVLPPPPEYIVDLQPPPPPEDVFVLPTPVFAPLPIWVDRPAYAAPPPVSVIAYNIHNTVIVNQNTVIVQDPAGNAVPPFANAVAAGVIPASAVPPAAAFPLANPPGHAPPPVAPGAQPPHLAPNVAAVAAGAAAAALPAAVLHVALPPSVASRGQQVNRPANGSPAPAAGGATNGPPPRNVALPPPAAQAPGHALPGHALPGQPGVQPLPLPPGQQAQPGPHQLPLPGQPPAGQANAPLRPGVQPLPVPPAQQAQPGPHQLPAPGQPPAGQANAPLKPGAGRPPSPTVVVPPPPKLPPNAAPNGVAQPSRPPILPREAPIPQQQLLEQQRAQQLQQQRAIQSQQQRAQQIEQQRAIQAQQQRAQQIQNRPQPGRAGPPFCGKPGLPPCG